jgi:hypothetical protein
MTVANLGTYLLSSCFEENSTIFDTLAVLSVLDLVTIGSNFAAPFTSQIGNMTIAIYSLILATTILATSLIIFRILRMGQATQTADISRYRKVIELIVESSALYSLSVIFVLPFLVEEVDPIQGYRLRFVEAVYRAMVVRIPYGCNTASGL